MNRYTLIIFDVDGVLLDSEPLYRNMMNGLFAELGARVSMEELLGYTGISAQTMWGNIKEKNGISLSVPELISLEIERKYQALQLSPLVATPGIQDLLNTIGEAGMKTAIASSGMRKNIDLILEKTGLSGQFENIVSGEMVTRGKPHPDIFLKAAEYFSAAPEQCIVIEDSTNGLLAASAAGMFGVAYRNSGTGPQDLRSASLIIDRFDEPALVKLIE